MKSSQCTGALLLSLSLLLSAHSQDYEACKSRAQRLMAQYKAEGPSGQQDKAAEAGEAWLEAARLCQDLSLRCQALEQAGIAFGASRNSMGDAQLKALIAARDLDGAPESGRARVALTVARITRQRKDWETACALSGSTPKLNAEALHELAISYLLEAKTNPSLNLAMAQNYEKAAAAYARFDLGRAVSELGQARLAAEKLPDRKAALEIVGRLSQTQLGYSNYQSPLGQSMVRLTWADSLEKLEALDQAQALRREVGKSTSTPADQREEAWLKASLAELQRKQPTQALKDLEQAQLLRPDNYVYSRKIALKKIEILHSQNNRDGIIQTWAALATHPKATPQQRDENLMEQIRWLRDAKRQAEADAILEKILAQPGSAQSFLQACKTRIARRIELKQFPEALQDLTGFETRFTPPSVELLDLRGYCLAMQGKDAEALDIWEKLHRDGAGRIVPSALMLTGTETIYHQYLAVPKLKEAAQLKTRVSSWWVQPILHDLWEAEYALAAQDQPAAAQALAKARLQLYRFTPDQRAQMEKRIETLAQKIKAPPPQQPKP